MGDEKRIKFLLLGEDKSASKAMRDVSKESGKTSGMLGKMGGALKGGLIGIASSIAIGEVVDFGKAAVDAFRDAEKSQRSLEDAYSRFPALADVSIEKLREQAAAIQAKVGADADDIAASQAVLARYKMTGKQMQQMTPLLVDYAKRTGKDLPAAAGVLGKAMMGSSRATKELGISAKLTKDPAKNLQILMKGLQKTVGGYAEKEAQTAAGKTEIMRARMGDLQEMIGGKLEPVMGKLLDIGMSVLDWLDANPKIIQGASAAFDGLVGIIEWLAKTLGSILAPILVANIKLFAMVVRGVAAFFDALSNVPGMGWAKTVAQNLTKVADGADAVADGINNIGKQKVVVKTDSAQSSVDKLRDKIRAIKDRIVRAKVEGNSKEADRLQQKLRNMRKQYNVAVNVIKTGIKRIAVKAVAGAAAGTAFAVQSYDKGGRPKVGQLAMFHADELWVPDSAGTVLTKSQTRRAIGNGPGALGGGGGTINIYVSGDTDPEAAARRIAQKLAARKRRMGKLEFE